MNCFKVLGCCCCCCGCGVQPVWNMFSIQTITQKPWSSVCLLYPIVYVISIPFTLAFKRYNLYIGKLWFVQFLEQYIVRKYMFHWFSVIYVANLIKIENGHASIPLKEPWTVSAIKIYFYNMIWLTLLLEWCFGSPIFERVSVATGAYCTIPYIYREYKCDKAGGTWVNAFDSSSHYTMLISNSLLVWRLILLTSGYHRTCQGQRQLLRTISKQVVCKVPSIMRIIHQGVDAVTLSIKRLFC